MDSKQINVPLDGAHGKKRSKDSYKHAQSATEINKCPALHCLPWDKSERNVAAADTELYLLEQGRCPRLPGMGVLANPLPPPPISSCTPSCLNTTRSGELNVTYSCFPFHIRMTIILKVIIDICVNFLLYLTKHPNIIVRYFLNQRSNHGA